MLLLFLFDFAYLVDAIYDAKPGATVPVDKYGGRIVNETDSAFVAGFKAGVGVIHLDEFHPCTFGVHFLHPIHGMLVGEVIICHNFHRLFSKDSSTHSAAGVAGGSLFAMFSAKRSG